MSVKKIISALLIISVALAACKKNGPPPKAGNTALDVYVCGHVLAAFNTTYATLWKNGTPVALSENPSDANGITSQNKDVYVAGNDNYKACYWKNGEIALLPGDAHFSNAAAITTNGNNVYVAGWTTDDHNNYQAVYWKNGAMVKLATNTPYSFANAITVQGTDVYVCGGYYSSIFKVSACYWKNGVQVPIGDTLRYSVAKGIAVNGTDVHVAFNYNNTANYYKNGVITKLANEMYSVTNGIALNNNNVYIAGGSGTISYWKNGTPVSIPNLSASWAIAINGNDLYLAGGYSNSTDLFATYWKNGDMVRLEQTRVSYATGVALVPQ